MKDKKKLVGVYLPPDLVLKLKLHVVQGGGTQSSVVEKAVSEYLKRPLQ